MTGAPLALVELLDRDGRVHLALPVRQWPLRIGRAIDNDLVLDDPHVAPFHASLEAGDDGAAVLVVQPGLNGVQHGRRRLRAGERLALAGVTTPLTLGTQRLRVRLAGEALAPERPLHAAPSQRGTLALALALWAWTMAGQAIQLDPDARLVDWLAPLLGLPALLAAWCLAWALASKLFQHRFDFWPHMAVAVRYLALAEALQFGLDWTAAVTSVEALSRISGSAAALVAVAMLVAHARLVLPGHLRALRVFAGVGFAAGAAVLAMQNLQRNDRVFNELYMATLPPPALLWAQPVSPQRFLEDSAQLRARLEAALRDSDADSAAAEAGEE